jgi:YHS domain-containing protein
MKTLSILKSLAIVAAAAISFNATAGVDTDTDSNDVTLAGHDAVAYFTQSAAIVGSSDFTAVHDGAIFYFASAANRDTFKSDADKYAPQYGVFCAYGAAHGKKFNVDGKAFEVVDGKLYVNKNLDVYEVWEEDKTENIETANGKWPSIKTVAAGDL